MANNVCLNINKKGVVFLYGGGSVILIASSPVVCVPVDSYLLECYKWLSCFIITHSDICSNLIMFVEAGNNLQENYNQKSGIVERILLYCLGLL